MIGATIAAHKAGRMLPASTRVYVKSLEPEAAARVVVTVALL